MDAIQDCTISSSTDSADAMLHNMLHMLFPNIVHSEEGDPDIGDWTESSVPIWLDDQCGPADSTTGGEPQYWELEAMPIERSPSAWSIETIPNQEELEELSTDDDVETDTDTETDAETEQM